MSVVTAVTLVCSLMEEDGEAIAHVNKWQAERGNEPLVDVSDHYGGRKHPQCMTLGAGWHHHFDVDEFAAFVTAQPWINPENVVLILQPEEGATRIWRPSGLSILDCPRCRG